MKEMNIEYLSPKDLTPYPANAKKHPAEQVEHIANSIREFGFRQPIVVDADNVVVIGHGRLLAAKKLGYDKVPVLRADDLTDAQIKALRLADNKTNESEWDFSLLEAELAELEMDFNMSDFGFEGLENTQDELPAKEDDFDPDAEVETKAKRGDIWELGEHRLMCGDSTSVDDVDALMDGAKADLLLTDPPYNVNYEGGTGMTIQNDNMEDTEFRQFLRDAFSCADGAMKPGAAFYIWHADSEGYNFRGACHDIGWTVRQCLIWNKNALVLGRQDYQWKHEPCLYGWKDGASHTWLNDRKQTTVMDFERPVRSDLHPTMKPIQMFDYQIRNSAPKGANVLDLFGGSGTTIIACEQNGRKAYVMELDPHYVDVIIARWEKLTEQEAVLLNG